MSKDYVLINGALHQIEQNVCPYCSERYLIYESRQCWDCFYKDKYPPSISCGYEKVNWFK